MQSRFLIIAGLGLGLAHSNEGHAFAYSSTAAAAGGGVIALVGASMAKDEDPDVAKKGKRLVKTGLIISGACSALGTALFAAGVAALASLDKVETLEAEIANGGGPTIDALASGFGVPKSTVMNAIDKNLNEHVNGVQVDLESFQQGVMYDLGSQLEFTTHTAADTLIALQEEIATSSMGEGSQHKLISDFSGVPISVVKDVVDRSIHQHLSSHKEDGKVLSARSLLHVDSIELIESIISDVERSKANIAFAG